MLCLNLCHFCEDIMSSFGFLFQHSIWFLFLCAAFSAGAAWLLYRVAVFGDEDNPKLRIFLASLRFLFLFILSLLLLEPMIKYSTTEEEKPIVAVVLDNSASMLLNEDSLAVRGKIMESLKALRDQMGEDHELRFFTAGSELKEQDLPSFSEEASNISSAIKSIDDQFENQNLAAIVFMSDGLYNQGYNPIYLNRRSTVPIHTVSFGDTSRQQDLILDEVRINKIAFLGNEFPIQMWLRASDLEGKRSKLVIKESGLVVFEELVNIEKPDWSARIETTLKAQKVGMVRYDISLESVDGEKNLRNNFKTVYIEIVDARNKVLLLAHAPHPDLAGLKSAIVENENYEVETQYAGQFREPKWDDINLLILHQLPSPGFPIVPVLEQAEKRNIPVWFIVGEATNLNQLWTWSGGLSVQGSMSNANTVKPAFNNNFELFKLSEETQKAFNKFPPLYAPFGTFAPQPANHVLLYQKIGTVETSDPLLAFIGDREQKIGVLFGEGFWRWRLYDFDQNETHEASNELVQKVVQFLSAKKDNRPFKAEPVKRRFDENEKLIFRAELYNANFQAVNEPDVNMLIKGPDNKSYSFRFNRDRNAYALDAGFLPPGDYSFVASTSFGGQNLESKGLFSVSPLELEALNTRADYALMQRLAEKNGGKNFQSHQLNELLAFLTEGEPMKTISYMKSDLKDLIRWPWLFWILLLFISTEWFIRKYKGAY